MARPDVKIYLKTKNNFEAFPGQYVDVGALWDGDFGLGGRWSDGKYIPSGGYGIRLDSITAMVDGHSLNIPTDSVYLNGKIEGEGVALWIKSKDTSKCVQFLTATEGEYGLRGQFAECIQGIRFTAISESGTEESFTVTPSQVFVNGSLNSTGEAATQPAEVPAASSDIPF